MDQAVEKTRLGDIATGKFSEAEFQMLRYQLEENEFTTLIRLITNLPSEKWQTAKEALLNL